MLFEGLSDRIIKRMKKEKTKKDTILKQFS